MEAIFEKISIELICLILYAILAEIFFNSVRNNYNSYGNNFSNYIALWYSNI